MKRNWILIAFALFAISALNAGNRYELEREYLIRNKSTSKELKIKLTLPGLSPYVNSRVLSSSFTPEPVRVEDVEPGIQKLHYNLSLQPGESLPLKMLWTVELEASEGIGQAAALNDERRAQYLAPQKKIESNHPEILALATELRSAAAEDRQFVDAVYHAVKKRLKPQGFGTANRGALYALRQGRGDCTEYAALIVALARAGGVPARINTAMSMQKDGTAHFDNHNNAEVYLNDRWLPVEPFFNINETGKLAATEIIMRIGLPGGPITWASWSTANSMKPYKEVKLVGHRWRKLN
jgi:transglutaminase-like putative cysteine protease